MSIEDKYRKTLESLVVELADHDGNVYEEVKNAFWHHKSKTRFAKLVKDAFDLLNEDLAPIKNLKEKANDRFRKTNA